MHNICAETYVVIWWEREREGISVEVNHVWYSRLDLERCDFKVSLS